jgi:hypothetical protein
MGPSRVTLASIVCVKRPPGSRQTPRVGDQGQRWHRPGRGRGCISCTVMPCWIFTLTFSSPYRCWCNLILGAGRALPHNALHCCATAFDDGVLTRVKPSAYAGAECQCVAHFRPWPLAIPLRDHGPMWRIARDNFSYHNQLPANRRFERSAI